MTTDSPTPSPIVLIHGLWLTPLSWEYWVERFEGKGHRVLAPAWPGLDKPIEELRRNTAPYERLGITEITDHYDAIIRGLDEPPIIIGHSFGGLITMLLLDRGLGASAVAISPAQPKGVLTLPPAQARVASVALRNPANRHKAQMLTEKQFHYGFTNTLSEAESKPIYDRYAVPGPGRVLFQAALANFNPNAASKINFKNDDRAPLLIMANGKDHTVPAASARATFKLQSKSKATTVLREYADRPHLTAGVVGWEEIADYALDWTTHHLARRQASGRRDRLTGYGSHLTRIPRQGARATSTPAGIPRGQSVTTDLGRPTGAVEHRPLHCGVAGQLVHPRRVVVREPAGGIAHSQVGRNAVCASSERAGRSGFASWVGQRRRVDSPPAPLVRSSAGQPGSCADSLESRGLRRQ